MSRLKFVEERRKIRAMETAKNKGNEKPKEKAQVWLTVISMFVIFFSIHLHDQKLKVVPGS